MSCDKNEHVLEDKKTYSKNTRKYMRGIAPCYRDKYARKGSRVCDNENYRFFS